MAIKDSGSSLAFSEIETEFGQNNDRDLGEYRVSQTVGGLINQPLDAGIPQSVAVGSSEISFSDFYSKRLNVIVDYHDTAANNPADAKSKYTQAATVTGRSNGNWTVIGQFKNPPSNTGGTKTRIHVNKNIGSAKGNATHCAVRTSSNWDSGTVLSVEIGASGKVIGAGGDGGAGGNGSTPNGGNGTDGTSALGIQYEGTSIFNNGDIIAGGGGGGGGGYRKVEREEWFSGPVYAANGGGGGGGQGLPNGTGGAVGSASGTTTFVSDGIFNDTDTSYNNAVDVADVTDGVFRKMGMIASVDSISAANTSRTAGTYNNVSYTAQGAGNNTANFNITVNGSGAASVTIAQSGKGYVVNNTITVADSQLGGGGAPSLTFDVASISDEFKFRRSGSTVGTNLDGDPLVVGSGVGSKRYIRVPKDNNSDNVTGGQPDEQVSNAPVNQIWRIEQFTLQNTSPGGGAGSNSSNTAGGSGGNGGNNSQAKGGGGGGGGFAASGGEGGNNNDGGAGTSSKGGNGADGDHTGSIEGENNVKGEGGTGGGSGAAIRKTNSNITVTISNDANSALFGGNAQAGDVQGVTNATGVTAG